MAEFIAEGGLETSVQARGSMGERYALYVGLDVDKERIAVATAGPGRGAPRYCGEIAHTEKAATKRLWCPRFIQPRTKRRI